MVKSLLPEKCRMIVFLMLLIGTSCDWNSNVRVVPVVCFVIQTPKPTRALSFRRMAPAESVTSDILPSLSENKQMTTERRKGSNQSLTSSNTAWSRTAGTLPETSHSPVSSDEMKAPETVNRSPESLQNPTHTKLASTKRRNAVPHDPPPKPYRADYETSKRSQKKIQAAAFYCKNNDGRPATALDRATVVLETFLNISPYRCNAANIVCALTLSAKTIGYETNDRFRDLLFRTTNDAFYRKLKDHSLSPRQLCNAVWALAKHYDRDEYILPIQPHTTSLSTDTIYGQAELWDLRNDVAGCPAQKLDTIIDEIAKQLTTILNNDVYSAKEGELCMACWAFGVLRRRRRPPGWQHTPQISKLPIQSAQNQKLDSSNFIKFEQWKLTDERNGDIVRNSGADSEAATVTGEFLDTVGRALSTSTITKTNGKNKTATIQSERIRHCTWSEMANVAWAFAAHGRACSDDAERLLNKIGREATRRLTETTRNGATNMALSRDIAQIIWSLGVLQADNFRLGDVLVDFVTAVANTARSGNLIELKHWTCPDIGQVVLALAHARIDDPFLIDSLYTEACRRFDVEGQSGAYRWKAWETSILLWAQARLYLTESRGSVYGEFPKRAISDIKASLLHESTFHNMGIGPQEQANIAWSLTVLDLHKNPDAIELLKVVYTEAASTYQHDGVVQLEHAHQLWQSLFILQDECPSCTVAIPTWFREYLQKQWSIEKSRPKISSARHLSISKTLNLMGVAHYNEHDEDIDVAIVLKAGANWTHETESNTIQSGVRVAVEFDGPYHFTRQGISTPGNKAESPRALGHTVLKYRLLKKQGWTVVRVPYYEYDKIPFWASMERQRYLQRLLKTHVNLRFSRVDGSAYKAQVHNRGSRFD